MSRSANCRPKFDKWEPRSFRLTDAEIDDLIGSLPAQVIEDIKFAQAQIRRFAEAQLSALRDIEVETLPGVRLGHRNIPVASVGCYVPGALPDGGLGPHVGATAKVAGVKRVAACTPPLNGVPPAATVAAMALAGADEIYCSAASRPWPRWLSGRVDRARRHARRPGNAYVAEAKRQLFGRVGIDLLAGPTETLVIADETADAEMCATDLLGQAEHGPDLPGHSADDVGKDRRGIRWRRSSGRLAVLPTADIAGVAWRDHGQVILCDTRRGDGVGGRPYRVGARAGADARPALVSGADDELRRAVPRPETNVAYGDKVIGTNHTLPTGGRRATRAACGSASS